MLNKSLLTIICAVLLCPLIASADTATFQPTPTDLYDLDHYRYYRWGIDHGLGDVEVTGATLFFDNIRNWDNNANDLYVHLLPGAPAGVAVGYDGQGGGDQFAGQGVLLVHYEDLPNVAQDITYTFSASEVAALNSYMQDGNFGLGFDPDCHYWNDGVTLTMEYVPEPATMGLLGLGGLGLLRRKRK